MQDGKRDRALANAALESKSIFAKLRGDYESGARLNQELRDKHRALGNHVLAISRGINVVEFEHALGKTERAVAFAREALAFTESGQNHNKGLRVNLVCNLIGYLVALDRLAEARMTARELLHQHGSDANQFGLATFALEHLALVLALGGDHARAAQLAAHANATLRDLGFEREFAERATRARLDALLAERLPSAQRESLTARGAAMRNDEAVALALGALAE